LLFFWK